MSKTKEIYELKCPICGTTPTLSTESFDYYPDETKYILTCPLCKLMTTEADTLRFKNARKMVVTLWEVKTRDINRYLKWRDKHE